MFKKRVGFLDLLPSPNARPAHKARLRGSAGKGKFITCLFAKAGTRLPLLKICNNYRGLTERIFATGTVMQKDVSCNDQLQYQL